MNTAPEVAHQQLGCPACIHHNLDTRFKYEKDTTAPGVAQVQHDKSCLSPNAKLATIEAVLNDEVEHIETAEDKKKAIKATLSGLSITGQEETEQRSYRDPDKKVAQIDQVIKNESLHMHTQFDTIQSILSTYESCNNPWVHIHRTLVLIEDSSRQSINTEEEMQAHLKQLWTQGMDKKAHFYPEMARDQKWWQYVGIAGMVAALSIPLLGQGLSRPASNLMHPLLSKVMAIEVGELATQIRDLSSRAPDFMNGMGSQSIQIGSNTSSLLKRDKETLHEWSTQQERQNVELQQQVVQEAHQNDRSLKEHHLEILKTLTHQLIGR